MRKLNDKNVEKIHERERLSEKSMVYKNQINQEQNICHLRILRSDCETINVKKSILSGILEYIYTCMLYIKNREYRLI